MADYGPMASDTADYGPSDSGPSFGSGLSFRGTPATTPAASEPIAAPAPSGPMFGAGLKNMLTPPSYRAPDPQATALDQASTLLQERIKRAGSIAANPIAQFFNPEAAQAARDFVPAATEQLQKIKQQQQHAVDVKQTASNWGLTNPNQFGEQATDTTLANEALRQWKDEGNFNAYKALSGLSPEWKNRADLYTPDAMAKFGDHVDGVSKGMSALNAAADVNSQAAYAAARAKVIKDNDLSALGIKPDAIPETLVDWKAKAPALGAQYNQAQRMLSGFRARQDQLNQAVPVTEEKVAGQIQGTYQFGNGEAIPGFKAVSLPGYGDVQGVMGPPGSKDTTQRGITWSSAAPEQVKTVREQLNAEEVKGIIGKYKMARDFAKTANNDKMYTSAAGLALISDELGAIGRDVAEGSKAAGSIGLTKMLDAKYGSVEAARSALAREASALKDWVSKGGPTNPRLSPPSIQGIKDVANFKRDQAFADARDRINQPLETAGRYGMQLKNMGLDPELVQDPALRSVYDAALKKGNQEIDSYPMVTVGDRRVMLPTGSNIPGAKVAPLDHGPDTASPAPGGTPPTAPSQAATQPTGPAGGTAPITIAGQQVTAPMPPGASPNFIPALQRIESGGEKDPWTSGTPKSSAGGAFQFINSTWAATKPPGAPDRARDATPEQQTAALATLTGQNAKVLQDAKLPVNDTTLYMAHNIGSGGATSLLSASPTEDARSIVGDKAAANNPRFFKGKPTVATVLDRYSQAMNEAPDEGPKPKPGAGGATAEQPPTFMQRLMSGDVPGGRATTERARETGIESAPAIGSTLGAAAGSVGGPLGTVAGGAAGGGAGQAFKDYMQGRDQSPTQIAKQTALGGVLGVASAGRPLVAAAARVGGSAAVEGGAEAAEGGGVDEVTGAALKGGGLALGGEALGRFISSLGPAAHKLFSKFTPDAQAELSAQAGKLVEARKVLATEQPKLAGEGAGANPKFEAAKKAEEDASQFIKDHGQKPDDMAYAYEQTKAGTSAGEAAVLRKAAGEESSISEGYDKLRNDMRETGVGAPKPNQPLSDGPLSTIRTAENPTGKVPEAFRADAEHAEMLAKAPAKDWGTKWQQLQDAGSELIKKRMAFLVNNDKPSAEAMNNIFQGVRNQQKAAAEYVFGKEQGAKVISHLEDLDKRYAKVMNATQGMNYEKMKTTIQGGNTPASRELESNFKEFAKDDPAAIRAFNAMKAGAKGRMGEEAKLMIPVIAGEFAANMGGVPTVGVISAAIGGHRLVSLMKEYMNAKLLGRPVAFKDFATDAVKAYAATHGPLNAAGSAVQRGMVQ